MSDQRKVGRKPMHGKAMQLTIPLRLPADLVDRIDAIVDSRAEQPSRNLVIRELIVRGLLDVEKKRR
jgi:metal-responsive CopG/Arc/MetJ family transcriptional regulator